MTNALTCGNCIILGQQSTAPLHDVAKFTYNEMIFEHSTAPTDENRHRDKNQPVKSYLAGAALGNVADPGVFETRRAVSSTLR